MVLSSLNQQGGAAEETPSSILAPSPIEMLPDEVLGKCFFSGFVNSMDIITSVTYVSKRTTEVAHKSVKMLDLRALPKLTAADIQTFVRRHANLSELDFGYCPQFGRDHLMALVAISETLQSLKLRGSALCNDDIVAYLDSVTAHLEGSPSRLQELDLSAIAKGNTSKIGDVAVSKISVSTRMKCICISSHGLIISPAANHELVGMLPRTPKASTWMVQARFQQKLAISKESTPFDGTGSVFDICQE